jgi:Domain of unknown function (DUF4350)
VRNPGLLLLAALVANGCGPSAVDTSYGRSRGSSINGTGVLAELFRQRGDEVRAAVRLSDTLSEWADVLVRFSPHPGPPDTDEGQWMLGWLRGRPGRRLVYVVRDFDAEPEFWAEIIKAQPKDAKPKLLDRLKENLEQSKGWVGDLPPKPKTPARVGEWFAVDPKPSAPSTCTNLGGPWAEEVDAGSSAISKHEGFRVDEDDQPVLLRGDGSPLAIAWTLDNGSRVLALANASFLLNASLLNRARRPLATRVVDWTGPGSSHVAFVEGDDVMAAQNPDGNASSSSSSSPFRLFQVSPFGRIAAHILIFLLLLALAYAVRLGRPRPEPPSGVERPSAHPEALGVLLARTGRADTARALLEVYRRWRHPSSASGRAAPAAPSSPPSPRA